MNRFCLACIVVTFISAMAFPVYAQQKDSTKRVNIADTIKKDLFTAPDTVTHLRSKAWTLVPPAALVMYGASSFIIHPLRRLDRSIYHNAMAHNFVPEQVTENYLQYAPVIIAYGVNLVGVHGKNTFVDRTLIYALSQGMLNLTVFSLKNLTNRVRPNAANDYSFPSGHTANAFAGAEFMAQELSGKSWIYGFVGYAFATTTGIFRIYHQDHWFSDVVAGAGFGILSTKAAYLLYPLIRNFFSEKTDKKKNLSSLKEKKSPIIIVLPSFAYQAYGLQLVVKFQ